MPNALFCTSADQDRARTLELSKCPGGSTTMPLRSPQRPRRPLLPTLHPLAPGLLLPLLLLLGSLPPRRLRANLRPGLSRAQPPLRLLSPPLPPFPSRPRFRRQPQPPWRQLLHRKQPRTLPPRLSQTAPNPSSSKQAATSACSTKPSPSSATWSLLVPVALSPDFSSLSFRPFVVLFRAFCRCYFCWLRPHTFCHSLNRQ
jgi:hypothetical protein